MDKYIKLLLVLPPDDVVEIIKDAINENDRERINILKAAIKLGMDPNIIVPTHGIPLLHYAILKNDISVVCNLTLNGAEIYAKDDDGFTPLHICAKSGNAVLLKFFADKIIKNSDENIRKKLNEQDVDGNTAFFISCYFGHFECVNLLLGYDCDVTIKNKYRHTAFNIILDYFEYQMEHSCQHVSNHHYHHECHHDSKRNRSIVEDNNNIKKYIAIFKSFIAKKPTLLPREMSRIREICLKYHHHWRKYANEILVILAERFPEIANWPCDQNKNTLLYHAINMNIDDVVAIFLSIPNTNLLKLNRYRVSYLHIAAKAGKTQLVEKIINAQPNITNNVCYQGKTAIEYALLPFYNNNTENENNNVSKSDEQIIEIIKLLKTSGVDINSRNFCGYRAIETAIQYNSIKVIMALIDMAVDLSVSINHNKMLMRPVINNDVYGFAVQLNRMDVIKLLTDKNIAMANYQIKIGDTQQKYIVPTAMILALVYKRSNIIKYFLDNNNIKWETISYTKKFLLKTAINENCQNRGVLKHFICYDGNENKYKTLSEMQINHLENNMLTRIIKKSSIAQKNIYEKIFKKYIPNYESKNKYILSGLMLMLSVLGNLFDDNPLIKIKNKKQTKCPYYAENKICKMFNEIDLLFDGVTEKFNDLENIYCIVSEILDYYRIEDIRYCLEYIMELKDSETEIKIVKQKIKQLSQLQLSAKSSRIKKCLAMVEFILDELEIDNEIEEYNSDSDYDYLSESDKDTDEPDDSTDSDSDSECSDSETCPCCCDNVENFDAADYVFDPIPRDNTDDDVYIYETENYQDFNLLLQDFENINDANQVDENTEQLNDPDVEPANCDVQKLEIDAKPTTLKMLQLANHHIEAVKRSLYKLMEPVKLNNHDILLNSLTHINNMYRITEKEIIIYDSGAKQKIIARVNKLKAKMSDFVNLCTKPQARAQPIKWIRHYGINIAMEGKTDANHMFPFILDWLLSTWTCMERRVRDPTAHIKKKFQSVFENTSYLLYFHGYLLLDGKMVEGCYEYFINANGTLFHRLFQTMDKIPIKIASEIHDSLIN